jgi:hypothetical protein
MVLPSEFFPVKQIDGDTVTCHCGPLELYEIDSDKDEKFEPPIDGYILERVYSRPALLEK